MLIHRMMDEINRQSERFLLNLLVNYLILHEDSVSVPMMWDKSQWNNSNCWLTQKYFLATKSLCT